MSLSRIPQIRLHRMKETQFLAPILLESPLTFEILEKVRDKHSIDKLDRAKTRTGNAFARTWSRTRR